MLTIAPFARVYPYYFLLRELYFEPAPYAPLPTGRTSAISSTSQPVARRRKRKSGEVKKEREEEAPSASTSVGSSSRSAASAKKGTTEAPDIKPTISRPPLTSYASSSSSSPSPLRSPHWRPTYLEDVSPSEDSGSKSDSDLSEASVIFVSGHSKAKSSTITGLQTSQSTGKSVNEDTKTGHDKRQHYKKRRVAQGDIIPVVATNRKRKSGGQRDRNQSVASSSTK